MSPWVKLWECSTFLLPGDILSALDVKEGKSAALVNCNWTLYLPVVLFFVVEGLFTLISRGLVYPSDIFLSLTSTVSVVAVSPLPASPLLFAVLNSCIPFLMIFVLLDDAFLVLGILWIFLVIIPVDEPRWLFSGRFYSFYSLISSLLRCPSLDTLAAPS